MPDTCRILDGRDAGGGVRALATKPPTTVNPAAVPAARPRAERAFMYRDVVRFMIITARMSALDEHVTDTCSLADITSTAAVRVERRVDPAAVSMRVPCACASPSL